MNDDTLSIVNTPDDIRERIGQYQSDHDPEIRLKEASTKIDKILAKDSPYLADLNIFKTVTINEFQNGVLMCESLQDIFKTFAIDMMRKLQQEYDCQTTSEKAIAELATMEYVRTLDLNWKMKESSAFQQTLASAHTCGGNKTYFSSDTSDKTCRGCNRAVIELKVYENLGRELDRANRHFLATIQTLRMMKQPPLQLTINSDTTVVGQNQIVQTNSR